jgi:hypothetical protein
MSRPAGNKKSKKAKGGNANPALKPAAALQAGSYPYHPEEEFLDKVSRVQVGDIVTAVTPGPPVQPCSHSR